MQIQIKAHFNKQTKDSKKELIQFYVKGEDERKPELNGMTREVVELNIVGVDQSLMAEFSKSSKDSKKTVLDFIVKGDTSAAQSYEFYRKAGTDVELSIAESQMSLEDFRDEEHDGINYTVNQDGTVEADPNQVDMEEVITAEPAAVAGADEAKADEVQTQRAKRKTKAEKEAEAAAAAAVNDDELPF